MMKWIISILVLASLSAWAGFDGDPLYVNKVETNGATFYAWRPFYSSSVEDGYRERHQSRLASVTARL